MVVAWALAAVIGGSRAGGWQEDQIARPGRRTWAPTHCHRLIGHSYR